MEQELDVARGKENEALAEMEFIKDKIKKQACISILKLVKFMSDELGPPGTALGPCTARHIPLHALSRAPSTHQQTPTQPFCESLHAWCD